MRKAENPHLVFRILCKIIKGGNVQLKFATFAEFAEARPKADEIWSCDRDCELHGGFGSIEYTIVVKSETVGIVRPVYEVY